VTFADHGSMGPVCGEQSLWGQPGVCCVHSCSLREPELYYCNCDINPVRTSGVAATTELASREVLKIVRTQCQFTRSSHLGCRLLGDWRLTASVHAKFAALLYLWLYVLAP